MKFYDFIQFNQMEFLFILVYKFPCTYWTVQIAYVLFSQFFINLDG